MLLIKPVIVYFTSPTVHEVLSERLSEHEKKGIELQGIRPTDSTQKSIGNPIQMARRNNALN